MSEDAHARPSGDAPEPLYDVNIPTPTHAERARTLVAGISTGTLCTLALEPAGYPYGSFVTVAFENGSPVFLISRLAEHTKNLERDSRASLLVAEGGSIDPLANGRVTMLGLCTRVERDRGNARAAFLASHPNALCRVGGGAPRGRWPPSAAQTVRAVFPHTAFTKTLAHGRDRWKESDRQG